MIPALAAATLQTSVQTLVAVGGASSISRIITSTDGVTWTAQTSPFGTAIPKAICWSPSLAIYVVIADGGLLATSPDGITWTLRTTITGVTTINSIAWSPTLGIFVAVGAGSITLSSTDGITWTSRGNAFLGASITSVVWSSGDAKFIAVGSSGKNAYSTNGTTWTSGTTMGGGFSSLTVTANAGGRIIDGGPSAVYLSTNFGGAWNAQSLSGATGQNWAAACWSPDRSLFLISGSAGDQLTSPDGVTWTIQPSPFTFSAYGSVWSPLLGMFVIVMDTMTIGTSSTGSSWTKRTPFPTVFDKLYAVAAAA